MQRTAKLRAFYARQLCMKAGAQDPRIERAFAAVPREVFAGPAPWHIFVPGPWWLPRAGPRYAQTPDDDPAFIYQDNLVALDPERGINIGEPSLHALCLAALAPQPGETILQVGAGSGYYTAILAALVAPGGQVHGYEIDPALAARAAANLAGLAGVTLHAGSGVAAGLPAADAVYVNAGITQPDPSWLDALRPGGRLLLPLQPEGGWGGMLLIRRPAEGGPAWPARFVSRAGFISCQAPQVAATGRGLAAAFAGGGWERVRAFHRDGPRDESCWFDGGDWWLSTRDP